MQAHLSQKDACVACSRLSDSEKGHEKNENEGGREKREMEERKRHSPQSHLYFSSLFLLSATSYYLNA